MNKRRFGTLGEYEAERYLTAHGYEIIEKNYRIRSAEIDIIAMDKNCLCFIEVKTRRNADFGFPSEAVDRAKQQKIILAAQSYLSYNEYNTDIRFDVVEVYAVQNGDTLRVENINLIKDAFSA